MLWVGAEVAGGGWGGGCQSRFALNFDVLNR
jgi:hypothetical protein